jgi:hypothetical protein
MPGQWADLGPSRQKLMEIRRPFAGNAPFALRDPGSGLDCWGKLRATPGRIPIIAVIRTPTLFAGKRLCVRYACC